MPRSSAAALGGLKGPIMKVAQLIATIPDALPPEYAAELTKLQSEAPPMGWAFVKRRMIAELGADWQKKFASFEHQPAAAASLGQVHRARSHDGKPCSPASCNIPTCSRRSKPISSSSDLLFALHRRMEPAIDTTEIGKEIGARIREELDYEREAKHVALYREMLAGHRSRSACRVCGRSFRPGGCSRSTGSKAASCSRYKDAPLEHPQPARAPRCSPPGGFRSAASA